MRRLREPFRRHSPVPPASAAEGIRTSTSSDALASVIKVLEIAEKALDGLSVPGLKQVISTIHIVLQSVEKSNDNQGALAQLEKQVGILNASVLKPLSECTEVPPDLESAVNNLRDKVEEAAGRCQEKQLRNRSRVRRVLLTDRDANELQGFASDIKEAVTMFKTSAEVQQMIQQFEEEAMFEKLNKIPHADGAGYDSRRQSAPVRCLKHTRTEVLEKIWCWIVPHTQAVATEPTSDALVELAVSDTTIGPTPDTAANSSLDTAIKPIYWVNGLAGIGKSTIARTVAEDVKDRNLLGASFFFSRQEKELSDAGLFIPTIAYQLTQSHPEMRPAVIKVFQRDPGIVKKSFTTQFKELIIEPLCKITSKLVVIIVDALDECNNSEGAADKLFRAIIAHCAEAPSLRLLVTSRPETYIRAIITGAAGIVLHEDIDQSVVSADIHKYLRMEMSRIPGKLGVKVPLPWPSEEDLTELVKRAGKLFIWAAMAVRFVGDHRGRGPIFRLETLLRERISPGSNSRNPYKDLDSLYRDVLSQAVEGLESVSMEDMNSVIGTVILLHSEMPLEAITSFLGDDGNMVEMALNRIQSIVPIPTDPLRPIQIYHPSFPDFITSRERCPDSRFYVDTLTHDRRLALQCLDILNNRLSEKVETLLKPTEEADAVSKDTVLRTIPQEVQYACRFWAVHVAFSSMDNNDEELMKRLDLFSSTMLLRWVVSMSILHVISDALDAACSMQQWIDDSGPWWYLKERFYDTERMLLANSDLISRHPAQLYYSVLPFLPSDTYLARRYPTPRGCISVLTGLQNSWPPSLFTFPLDKYNFVTYAPGGQMFAVVHQYGIDIHNASNGLLNSSIRTIGSTMHYPHLATFTEDRCGVVVVWAEVEPSICYQIEKFDLVKQNGQICRTAYYGDGARIKLSEYGSYVAFAGWPGICIRKTDGSDDISIPLDCVGKVKDLDLAGESAHLVAVTTEYITILRIPSGGVQRTLYYKADYLCISHDGSFLAAWSFGGEAGLWSITQGTLLATFKGHSLVFSRTNRLYARTADDSGKVYDASADPNNVTIQSFSLPSDTFFILPTPDESRILFQTGRDIQIWPMRQFTDTRRDTPRDAVLDVSFSDDASLLALGTVTSIEIWDARIGQRLHVICRTFSRARPVTFSPKGEFIVSESNGRIAVVDVRAGALLPITYSSPLGRDSSHLTIKSIRISFDSTKLAAINTRYHEASDEAPSKWIQYICVWDLPSGILLHSLECGDIEEIQWSWTDQYLLIIKGWYRNPQYLNIETFQEAILEHPGDLFQRPVDHLYHEREVNTHRIWLSIGREEPLLLLALPSNFYVKFFSSRGDRACIFTWDGELLLLNTSGLEAYIEICLPFEPEVTDVGNDTDADEDDDDTDEDNNSVY